MLMSKQYDGEIWHAPLKSEYDPEAHSEQTEAPADKNARVYT
jgi:hypothetical protein